MFGNIRNSSTRVRVCSRTYLGAARNQSCADARALSEMSDHSRSMLTSVVRTDPGGQG